MHSIFPSLNSCNLQAQIIQFGVFIVHVFFTFIVYIYCSPPFCYCYEITFPIFFTFCIASWLTYFSNYSAICYPLRLIFFNFCHFIETTELFWLFGKKLSNSDLKVLSCGSHHTDRFSWAKWCQLSKFNLSFWVCAYKDLPCARCDLSSH